MDENMKQRFFDTVIDSEKFDNALWHERYRIVVKLAEDFGRQYSCDVNELITYFWENY